MMTNILTQVLGKERGWYSILHGESKFPPPLNNILTVVLGKEGGWYSMLH